MRDSARKQRSHFPIDLHCQPSQNGAQLYSGSDVSVITGLIKIFLLKVNWSIQEHMITGAGNCTYSKVQDCSPTFNKLASDMFPYKELLEPRAHTE